MGRRGRDLSDAFLRQYFSALGARSGVLNCIPQIRAPFVECVDLEYTRYLRGPHGSCRAGNSRRQLRIACAHKLPTRRIRTLDWVIVKNYIVKSIGCLKSCRQGWRQRLHVLMYETLKIGHQNQSSGSNWLNTKISLTQAKEL